MGYFDTQQQRLARQFISLANALEFMAQCEKCPKTRVLGVINNDFLSNQRYLLFWAMWFIL